MNDKTAHEIIQWHLDGLKEEINKIQPSGGEVLRQLVRIEDRIVSMRLEMARMAHLLASCNRPLVVSFNEVNYLIKMLEPGLAGEIERSIEGIRREMKTHVAQDGQQ